MIRISQISDDLSVYKENQVVLFGIGYGLKTIIELLHYHEIDIDYICDNNKSYWGKYVNDIQVISPRQLKQLTQGNNAQTSGGGGIVVQIAVSNTSESMNEQFLSLGVKTVISFDEAQNVLNCMFKMDLFENNKLTFDENEYSTQFRKSILKEKFTEYVLNNYFSEQLLLICMPMKTGDNTLMSTFSDKKIQWLVMDHSPENFDKALLNSLSGTVKVITALREPISQNLSIVYQGLSGFGRNLTGFGSTAGAKSIYTSFSKNFFENGGDAQTVFTHNWDSDNSKKTGISDFLDNFKEKLIDLSKYPFDHEKGYSIIKEGNIEVFVYQLERLNDIASEMSDWVGETPFDTWIMGNEANSKWIANSYKQAQKEITFSLEYFECCYNDPWVQHFYSQEDIEKFKERWKSHIK